MSTVPGLTDQFNHPPTDDNTSAPAEPTIPQPSPLKPKKPNKLKNPGALAAAISKAKRARQTGQKWG